MTIITQVAKALQTVLTQRADELGRSTGFIQRERNLTGSQFAQALVFGWLANGQARLETLRQSAMNVGASISRQGLDQRFSPRAAHFLQEILKICIEQVVMGSREVKSEVLGRFEGIYIADSTTIELPSALRPIWCGSNGSALKVSLCWELQRGTVCAVEFQQGIEHDQSSRIAQLTIPSQALLLADLGYFQLQRLQDIDQAQALWITRYKSATRVYDRSGQPINLLRLLEEQGEQILDCPVFIGQQYHLPCRLIAQRVPPHVLRQRQAQLRRWESRKQKRASPQRWALLAWSIYLTNAPISLLNPSEVLALAHVRWQIELLFKLWKDGLQLDEWRTDNPWRILCEVYAKLIACIIQHWLLLVGGAHALERSMTQALPVIRHWAWGLAFALPVYTHLCDLITHLGRILASSASICSSTSSLPTFQLLRQSLA
jgi:hypothetical protein